MIDILVSVEKVTLPFSILKRLPEEVVDKHTVSFEIDEEAVDIASSVGMNSSYQRRAGGQQNSTNTPANFH